MAFFSLETRKGPKHAVVIWEVRDISTGRFECGLLSITGHWDEELGVVGSALGFEVGFDLDGELDACQALVFQSDFHSEKRPHVHVDAVGGQFELPVGGNERNGSVVFEFRQANALVELDVFDFDSPFNTFAY